MSGDVFCNRCGHRNPAAARFCSSCGAALDTTLIDASSGSERDTEHHENLIPEVLGVPCLAVESGHRAGAVYAIDQPVVTIGRHPDSDVFLDDVTVSRRHAEVHQIGDVYEVRDVGSLNGTYLNRVRSDGSRLNAGDELQVGKFKLVFLLPESRG